MKDKGEKHSVREKRLPETHDRKGSGKHPIIYRTAPFQSFAAR